MSATRGRRAAPGGEQGLNGEWYQGGQFMPASALTVKGQHKQASHLAGATHRVLIEPGKLEDIPRAARALFPRLQVFVAPEQDGTISKIARPAWFPWDQHFNGGEAELDQLIAAYNRGIRYGSHPDPAVPTLENSN